MKYKKVEMFTCGACNELLFEGVPLPCGEAVCQRCFRLPRKKGKQGSNSQETGGGGGNSTHCESSVTKAASDNSKDTQESLVDAAISDVGAYLCPSRSCKRMHRFREEKVELVINYTDSFITTMYTLQII